MLMIADNYYVFKIVTPNWATNPTYLSGRAVVLIEL